MFQETKFVTLFVMLVMSMGCSPEPAKRDQATNPKVASDAPKEPAPTAFADKLAQVEKLLQSNQLDAAWSMAKELIVEQPNSPPATFLAARILAQRKNLNGAIQMISKIDPNDPEAGLAAVGQLAEWLAQTGNLAEAEIKAKQVLTVYPTAVPAMRLLVDIFHAQGRRWEAYRVIDRLVRLGNFSTPDLMNSIDAREPVDMPSLRDASKQFDSDMPYNKLADLRMLTGANRWSDAVEDLSTLAGRHPQLLEPWIWMGESLIECSRWSELSDWLAHPPESHDNHPEYWYILGRIHEQQEAYPQAARCYAETLRRDRRHLPAMQSLSDCLAAMKQWELATEVRTEAGKLVRIKDLSQQIQRGLGKREEYIAIADLYRELADPVGAFGWDTILRVNEQTPIPPELIELQKTLRTGTKVECRILSKLPVDSWPLPENIRVAPPTVSSEETVISSTIPVRFQDVALQRGINHSYVNGADPDRGWTTIEGIGGGVSALDFDRDGWIDLFFSQAGDSPVKSNPNYLPKSLYRSIESKRFVEVAGLASVAHRGFGQGTGVADIDQDGFDDLLVADMSQIAFFRNQGDGTFETVPLPQAPSPAYWNSSIQAADLNGDTLPDIVQCEYIHGDDVFHRTCPSAQNSNLVFCHPKRFEPGKSRILMSGGDGSWELAPQSLLDSLVDGYALGSLITDLDGQGGNDVYFANDVSPNHLLMQQRNGDRFGMQEVGMQAGVAVDALGRAQASMGLACGDQNRDGLLDLIVTNFRYEDSTLYLQTSPGVFVDGTRTARLGEPTREWLSFGCQLADMDNDGWLDFIAVNGHIDMLTPWKMPPQVLLNRNGKFEWLRRPSPGDYFDVDNVGRSLTMTDMDRDGRVDFVITHLDRPAALLHNESSNGSHAYAQFELIGVASQREAIGARVELQAGREKWIAPVSVGDGFYGTNERIVHLGLGAASQIDQVEIVWPSGHRESFRDLPINKRYRIVESQGIESIAP